MNIYINPEKSPAAVQAKATGSPVSSLRLKRGANLNLSVVVMGSTTACNLRFGIKAKGDYEGSLLAYAEATTGQATDEGMKKPHRVGEGDPPPGPPPKPLAVQAVPSQRCLSRHGVGVAEDGSAWGQAAASLAACPRQPPVVECSKPATPVKQKPRTLSGTGLLL